MNWVCEAKRLAELTDKATLVPEAFAHLRHVAIVGAGGYKRSAKIKALVAALRDRLAISDCAVLAFATDRAGERWAMIVDALAEGVDEVQFDALAVAAEVLGWDELTLEQARDEQFVESMFSLLSA